MCCGHILNANDLLSRMFVGGGGVSKWTGWLENFLLIMHGRLNMQNNRLVNMSWARQKMFLFVSTKMKNVTFSQVVNGKDKRRRWVPKLNFYHSPTSFSTKMTICHHLWIFNEDLVNFKNKCQNWIRRPRISQYTDFQHSLTLFSTKWQYVTIYEYLMRTLSISKINARIEFADLKLASIPIFITLWPCFTLKWQYVVILWIFNEDFVNFPNIWQIWIPRPKISQNTKFQPFLTLLSTKMTICHHVWIFNENYVNFKNECQNWIAHPKISQYTNF